MTKRDFLRLERFWREVLLNLPAERLTTEAVYSDDQFSRRINYFFDGCQGESEEGLLLPKSCKEFWESQAFKSATVLGWAAVYFHSLGFLLRPFFNQELKLMQVTLSEGREEELKVEELSEFFNLDEEEADWLFLQEENDFYVAEYLSPKGTDIVDVCLRFQKFLEIGGLTEQEEYEFVFPF